MVKAATTNTTTADAGEQPSQDSASSKLVDFNNFIHTNPKSDLFPVKGFHHAEFWCGDATNTARRFSWGLGMPIVSKSDLSTGNSVHASYLLRSGDMKILFTAPYSPSISNSSSATIPTFSVTDHRAFTSSHGLAVLALAIEVADVYSAFSIAVSRGAKPIHHPVLLDNSVILAELNLCGDLVLRLISYKISENFCENSHFLPGFELVEDQSFSDLALDYGVRRLDHTLVNVPEVGPVVEYVKKFTGFHEFFKFKGDEVGTNAVFLANNDENFILGFAHPVHGTMKRKSHTQNYLEHNEGPGVQHMALMSEDIFRNLREMRKWSGVGGFGFMPRQSPTYYKNLKSRAGGVLSDEQIKECEELGILVDGDDEGTLLQIFTQPVGDRPTIFLEIMQRLGCMLKDDKGKVYQKPGCGGFGRANVPDLIRSVQQYEKTLEAKQIARFAAE